MVPAERMKAKKEHRVPLSERAVELLRAQLEISHSDFAFPAPRGGMLSDMTLTAVLRRMKVDAVPHGFRSTFRDWAAEQTGYANEVAGMALAHAVGNKVEAAYRRGDLLEKRVQLMSDWAALSSAKRASGRTAAPCLRETLASQIARPMPSRERSYLLCTAQHSLRARYRQALQKHGQVVWNRTPPR
ncbi:tyrosine-type recombinase/integrase [Variovorax boronicumulans]|uniref:tyrosine-type recombinase/integrase n=1 Tax=Variovorax boronicumulans TaxID=436515 RepID=UPI0035A82BEA